MNRSGVAEAVKEAKRFIAAADKLLKTVRPDSSYNSATGKWTRTLEPWKGSSTPCKEAATVKRASLDLSNALSEMRKRGQ